MTNGSPWKLIIAFGIPLVIGNIFQQFYNMVDSIIVGKYVGKVALAAVGSTGSLNFMIIGFGIGIVGISGSLPYMDGTDIRVPFFTSFDPKTGSWIIENHGVDPDILIDNDPVKEWNGEDQQLDRAIQEVMKELQDRKPLPGVPTPRDFSK